MAGKKSPGPEEAASINGETRNPAFGEFDGWTYAQVLTYRPKYIEFLLEDIGGDEITEKKIFAEWIHCNNVAITAVELTVAVD